MEAFDSTADYANIPEPPPIEARAERQLAINLLTTCASSLDLSSDEGRRGIVVIEKAIGGLSPEAAMAFGMFDHGEWQLLASAVPGLDRAFKKAVALGEAVIEERMLSASKSTVAAVSRWRLQKAASPDWHLKQQVGDARSEVVSLDTLFGGRS